MLFPSRTVTESIDVDADTVYEFARTMDNLPRWASGLASGIHFEDGSWFTDSPMGRVKVAMAERNPYRVLDHDVTLPDGTTVHNAFRVTPAGTGCTLGFVVLRMPGVSDQAFEGDVAHVARDLKALKTLLEGAP